VRLMIQAGLSTEQIRLITSGQAGRIAACEPLAVAGPAIGERARAPRTLLERVVTFTTIGALSVMRGDPDGRGHEQLALARLACNVPDGIDDARAPRMLLMLAASVSRTPDVPLPAGL
jgi:hypothetical protein